MAAPIGPTFFPPLGPAGGSSSISPKGWDRCTLADQVLPGFCKVNLTIRLKIDRKPKKGADGANPTSHGIDPQPGTIDVMTFTDDDRELLAAMVLKLVPRPGVQQKPVSIDHPSLRPLGITSVLVTGASTLTPEGPMRARMQFHILHWLPTEKKDATNTAKGAPVRKVKNNGPASKNPPPTEQPGVCGPPFTPAH